MEEEPILWRRQDGEDITGRGNDRESSHLHRTKRKPMKFYGWMAAVQCLVNSEANFSTIIEC